MAAVQMGLIYVNPEGPNANPDPLGSARDIRETFGRMAMNDEETVALIAGGHTFGKTHGAADPNDYIGAGARGCAAGGAGFWLARTASAPGSGRDTITSGIEVTWTSTPDHCGPTSTSRTSLPIDWELTKSPAGANQWQPKSTAAARTPCPTRRTARWCARRRC